MTKVLRFSAAWCQPCKNLAKILASENIDIPVYDIDEASVKDLVYRYKIRSVPTIVIDRGGDDFDLIVGASLSQLHRDKIKQALGS